MQATIKKGNNDQIRAAIKKHVKNRKLRKAALAKHEANNVFNKIVYQFKAI